MKYSLVIVESPTKAKTISKFLGGDYKVESSFGHVRDLPKRKLGVDVEHDFTPEYVLPTANKKTVTRLKKLAKSAAMIYFATDEDREGEAIAWHLAQVLAPGPDKMKRITFHEITKTAIQEALANPRAIDQHLVDAQQARRVLDRLVGYELSPLLWKKVAKGLSAGRVQSVAVRLIVEREREIQNFKKQEFWTIEAQLTTCNVQRATKESNQEFIAKLYKIDNKKLEKFDIPDQKAADGIITALEGAEFKVMNVDRKKITRTPLPPFTTSTLQQDANSRFGWSAKQTMYVAQQLYEGVSVGNEGSVGLITYMRTDSVNLSTQFTAEAEQYISSELGSKYTAGPKVYATKSKSAQEAHEAIRPTAAHRSPETMKPYLDAKLWKLYDLIWRRAMASQMTSAELESTIIDIAAREYGFKATGSTVAFDGFLKLYPTKQKDELLPLVTQGDSLTLTQLIPTQRFTEPPPRYSEASLVKTLEEYGIGRPSTYAPTISTIQDRNYVRKVARTLVPTDIAMLVNDLLVEHFNNIVDYTFTAHMEDELDDIAAGSHAWVPTIKEFYTPFKMRLIEKMKILSKKEITEQATDEVCEKCGLPMVIKTGRFGKFLACTGFPQCRNTKNLKTDGNGGHVVEEQQITDEKCPTCSAPMVVKNGRFGAFLSCSRYPDCKTIKAILKSIGMSCPKCQKGDIIERRSKRGRTFYGCATYPACDFALWSKPTGERCPTCTSLLVHGAKGVIRCSNKACDYESSS